VKASLKPTLAKVNIESLEVGLLLVTASSSPEDTLATQDSPVLCTSELRSGL
jgi:hypothetical protein